MKRIAPLTWEAPALLNIKYQVFLTKKGQDIKIKSPCDLINNQRLRQLSQETMTNELKITKDKYEEGEYYVAIIGTNEEDMPYYVTYNNALINIKYEANIMWLW